MLSIITISTAIILIVLVLMQVKEGGLNLTSTSIEKAPLQKRGTAQTLHILTIVFGAIFVGACIASFLA